VNKTILRWILSVALLAGVYSETGVWTAIVILLVFVRFELEDHWNA
jgi:hypothetical protein